MIYAKCRLRVFVVTLKMRMLSVCVHAQSLYVFFSV